MSVKNLKYSLHRTSIIIHHDLKCEFPYFDEVACGDKPFEVRRDDRDFKMNDLIKLHEVMKVDSGPVKKTGKVLIVKITYILKGERWGIKEGFCVLGVKRVYL